MANISLDINDTDARRMLSGAPDKIARALTAAHNDATALLLRELSTYPPLRSGSTYKRTGTLRRSWSRRIEGSGLEQRAIVGSNSNIAPYNRAVQDEEEQRPAFRGRWTNTVQGVMRRNQQAILEMYQARIRQELG